MFSHRGETNNLKVTSFSEQQGIEEYVEEFLSTCHRAIWDDVCLMERFQCGLDKDLRFILPCSNPYWTLETYIAFALYIDGSPFTVGKAEDDSSLVQVNGRRYSLNLVWVLYCEDLHTLFNNVKVSNCQPSTQRTSGESWKSFGPKPSLLSQCKQESLDTIIIMRRRWRWTGHVIRMEQDDIVRTAPLWTPEGKWKRGRPKNTWHRSVKAELNVLNHTWTTPFRSWPKTAQKCIISSFTLFTYSVLS